MLKEYFMMGTLLERTTRHCCSYILLCINAVELTSSRIRRFLRARRFDLVQSKKMFKDCQEWRKTVEGVGIDELYKRIDPFDVSHSVDF